MKVALVAPYFTPHVGGVESHVLYLARMLTRAGDDVTVLTSRTEDAPASEYLDGIHIIRERTRAILWSTPVTPGIRARILAMDVDLVHAHTPPPLCAYYASRACAVKGIPFVLTYHCDPIITSPLGPLVLSVYRRTIGPSTLKRADELILTSGSYDATSIVTWMHDARIIPNAVDTSRFTPEAPGGRVRERFHIGRDETLVLFVGRMVPHKGVQYLLPAMERMGDRVRLLLVGDGPLLPEFRRQVSASGLDGKVILAGRVSERDLPEFYAACDIFVLPSTSRLEAFGIAALEAMSTARPVIVSDIPGVRDVIEDGCQGFLSQPCSPEDIAEKVARLHEDPEMRVRMGLQGRKTVEEKFSWEKISPRIREVYFSAMERRGNDASAGK